MDRLFELNRKLYSAHSGMGFGVIASSKQTVVPTVGGWVELGRTTLGSAGDTISVGSLANKRYYMILYDMIKSGNATTNFRMGSGSLDATNNYADRGSNNGAADGTRINVSNIEIVTANAGVSDFLVGYTANLSAKEKLFQAHWMFNSATGAATAPQRIEKVGKWVNTSNPLDIIGSVNTQSGDYAIGTELVILGWDPADTHTTNFWEELAVDTGDGSSTDITLTFTAKKYLWIQAYIEGSSSAVQTFRLGSSSTPDTGANYATRSSSNGGTDFTAINKNDLLNGNFNEGTLPAFWNIFIINVASNEKLIMMHRVFQNNTGASNAPARFEWVQKWVNTSNQADIFEINRASGNWTTSSIVKVWGSD